MAKWTTHVDNAGTINETEVHEVQLRSVVVEVSKEKSEKLWVISILEGKSHDLIGHQEFDEDLIVAKRKSITKCMKLFDSDATELGEAMQQTLNESLAAGKS